MTCAPCYTPAPTIEIHTNTSSPPNAPFNLLVETARSTPSVGGPDLGARHDLGNRTEKQFGHEREAQSLNGLLLFGREGQLPEDASNLAAPDLLGRILAKHVWAV